ncbi:4f3b4a17-0ff1-440d-86c7-1d0c0eb345d7 [Sclerotinia trifoliorum]|uniref:Cytochrome c oxidase assembly protein COX20, mitochondrial n=1 Tax=Sclerotinia trifoliorum TaxID=28548 RepID=A0A8H2ZYA7_9HELO|nr:4f3b4a17-0ff1-440d-86c7-1d0c0eb345d7 [Sclerotinia trifoliorum]
MTQEPRNNKPVPQEPSPNATSPPKTYEVFHTPPENANALAEGSGQNTAGTHKHKGTPSLGAAIKTLRWQDFAQVHMYPCARESFLTGIGGGFAMGGIRAIFGAPIPKAANWAVGTFVFSAFGAYEFCFYRRRLERAHMKRAVEIIDRKKVEKEAQAEERRKERRRLKEEADKKAEEAAKKSNWKFW